MLWRSPLLLGLVLASAAFACAERRATPERVVLIVVDTLRRDHLSPYGSANETPTIASLAARGQVFTHAVASFHQTSMSMASLFTGRTPSMESGDPEAPIGWNGTTWCGMTRFAGPAEDPACIPQSVPTLAEELRAAGYWTIGIASNHFLFEPSGFGRGFDDWVEVGERAAWGVADREKNEWSLVNRAAIEAIDRRETDRLFLYVHYMDVHDYQGSGAPRGSARDDFDADATRRSYAEAVGVVDAAIGKLLDHLERAKLLDGATVILTSDHGEKLGERHPGDRPGPAAPYFGHLGNPSFEEQLLVPLIVAPALTRESDSFVRSDDLFHLILEIGGRKPGRASVLDPDEVFLSELFYRTYRKGRFKLALRREDGAPQLFDLREDPAETRDVAERHSEVVEAYRRRTDELSRALASSAPTRDELSPRDRDRLRALGYLEE